MSPEQGTSQIYITCLYIDMWGVHVHVYIPVDNSHLHLTPQAPLNHSGFCLCDLMFGYVEVTSGSFFRGERDFIFHMS